jgi:predicted dinucleotide-utilizing enzyme
MSGEKAVKLKDEGNVLFKRGRFNEALEKYSQGISINSTLSLKTAVSYSHLLSNSNCRSN